MSTPSPTLATATDSELSAFAQVLDLLVTPAADLTPEQRSMVEALHRNPESMTPKQRHLIEALKSGTSGEPRGGSGTGGHGAGAG